MKLNLESTGSGSDDVANGADKPIQPGDKPAVPVEAGISESFRRLKADEVVSPGDFVKNGHQGFEPWEGPSGFRASSFVKPIYRRQKAA